MGDSNLWGLRHEEQRRLQKPQTGEERPSSDQETGDSGRPAGKAYLAATREGSAAREDLRDANSAANFVDEGKLITLKKFAAYTHPTINSSTFVRAISSGYCSGGDFMK